MGLKNLIGMAKTQAEELQGAPASAQASTPATPGHQHVSDQAGRGHHSSPAALSSLFRAGSEGEAIGRSEGAYPSVDSSHRDVENGREELKYNVGMEAVALEEEEMSSAAARSASRLQNLEEQSTKLKEDLAKAMQSLHSPPTSSGARGEGIAAIAAQAVHVPVHHAAAAIPAAAFPEGLAPVAHRASSPNRRTYVGQRSQLQMGGYSPVLDASHGPGPVGGSDGAGAGQKGTDRAAEEHGGATRKDGRRESLGAEQGRDSPHPLDVDVAWIRKLAAAYSPRPRPEHPEFARIMTLPPLEVERERELM